MKISTKKLCRAGVIAALYAVLTYVFAPFAFGPFQLRVAEALCILPLLFPEAVPALWVGCMLSNLTSPYFFYDVTLGSLATLLAATLTYLVGRTLKGDAPKLLLGGLFPVLCNAVILPFVIVFLYGGGSDYASLAAAYFLFAGSVALSEGVCVYALGAPLYFGMKKFK